MGWIDDLHVNPVVLMTLLIIVISLCISSVIVILVYRLNNEKRVTRAALELKKITNSIKAGLVHFVLEDNCRIIYASQAFYEMLGYDRNSIDKDKKYSLVDFMDNEHLAFIEDVKKQLGNETIRTDVKLITSNGNQLYMLMNGNSTLGKDGKHKLSVVFLDISEQKRIQDISMLEAERYRVATELSNDVLFEYNLQADEMIHTEKFREMFGRNPIMPGFISTLEDHKDNVHPDDWGIFLEYGQQLSEGRSIIEVQYRIKNRVGEFIWCQVMGKTIYDDKKKPIRVIGKIVNVDAQKRELEALEYKATRDPLTGVYNKEVTIKKIDKYISGNSNGTHMFMLIDFDNYKSINDRYGHLRGDKVLVCMMNRIKNVFNEGEIIGRIGGDEFVVFAGNISGNDEALLKAKSLNQALDTSYISDDYSIPISGSIGIALYHKDGSDYEQLMECADTALYNVKNQGKNSYSFYSPLS